ncbi:O-antigen ligase-like membrane protein [Micromonospora sp. Llam0]|uniref:O-antigen ligase family protein n=1 Tax=Micromonospora sp. Llam0 TaxID=2485143 RepID=UPI000F47789E|nr:O-antigen ligase family protein [Micromonospora sp. Llam0]ROO62215.1 O-antigen ligase-like membrane protein [Micromonospora sp. Llam0]
MSSGVHPADLEPAWISERTYVTRRRLTRIDAPVMLSLMVCLLTLIPSHLILPGMTDLGRPALIVAILMWFWWMTARLNSRLVLTGPQPLRWAILAFLLSMLLSYAIGFLRGLTVMEANAADRWMLTAAAVSGVILLTADGMPNWDRLDGVLRVFVYCCAFVAVVGLIQAFLYFDLTQYMRVPGLQMKGWVVGLEVRGGGVRVPSTTFHYIEFSLLMAMALPFAIHFARFSATSRHRQMFAFLALLIAAAIPATMSRTGFVALAIVLLVLMPTWAWRMRYNMMALGLVMFAGMAVVKPSLVTTITNMFLGASTDPSITSRTERYEMVGYYFTQRPWFGRGTGTWVSPQYQYLDNQWLAFALTNGVVGVAVLAALHVTAIVVALLARRRSTSERDRHLCSILIAVQLVAIAAGFTFDSLSFSTYAVAMSLMVGMCGAVWRLSHPALKVRTSTPRWFGS